MPPWDSRGKGSKRRRDAESTTSPLLIPRTTSRRRLPPVSSSRREDNRPQSRFMEVPWVRRRVRGDWKDETSDATSSSSSSSSSSSVSFVPSSDSSSSLVDLSSMPPATESEVGPPKEVIDIADDSSPLQSIPMRRRSTLEVADDSEDERGGGESSSGGGSGGLGEDESVVEVPDHDAPDDIVLVDTPPISSRSCRPRRGGVRSSRSPRSGRARHSSVSRGSGDEASLVRNESEGTTESSRRRGRRSTTSVQWVARHRMRQNESSEIARRLRRQEHLRQERSDAEMARRLQSEEDENALRLGSVASARGVLEAPASAMMTGRPRIGSTTLFSVSGLIREIQRGRFLRMSLLSRDLTPADYESLLSLGESFCQRCSIYSFFTYEGLFACYQKVSFI